MSTPAFQPLPSARRTSAPISGSRPAEVMTSASSNHPASVGALIGGSSMTTSAMPSGLVQVMGTGQQCTITSASFDFGGRVVLVTGGTAGIGRVICEQFLASGAEVVTCGRNEPDQLPEAAGRTA